MTKNISEKNVFSLLRISINTLFENKIIFFPFCVIGFFQLLALETLYFSPRFPLKIFFGPIISTLWSENFLHYPMNFVLLPKLFQYAQIPIYIFISSFFIAVAIAIINTTNNGKTAQIKLIIKKTLSSYIHIIVASVISFLVVMGLFKLYGLVFDRAVLIRSESGLYYLIKRVVMDGAPYFNLMLSVLVTTLFAYVLPIIVIEKKKVFAAVIENFKTLFGSFWFTFFVVAIPSLFFTPVLLLRNLMSVGTVSFPELSVLTLIISVLVMLCVDATIYTSLTMYYLLKKERA